MWIKPRVDCNHNIIERPCGCKSCSEKRDVRFPFSNGELVAVCDSQCVVEPCAWADCNSHAAATWLPLVVAQAHFVLPGCLVKRWRKAKVNATRLKMTASILKVNMRYARDWPFTVVG